MKALEIRVSAGDYGRSLIAAAGLDHMDGVQLEGETDTGQQLKQQDETLFYTTLGFSLVLMDAENGGLRSFKSLFYVDFRPSKKVCLDMKLRVQTD